MPDKFVSQLDAELEAERASLENVKIRCKCGNLKISILSFPVKGKVSAVCSACRKEHLSYQMPIEERHEATINELIRRLLGKAISYKEKVFLEKLQKKRYRSANQQKQLVALGKKYLWGGAR